MRKIRAVHQFPAGFLWGTTVSARQVEGGETGGQLKHWPDFDRFPDQDMDGPSAFWKKGGWKKDINNARLSGQNCIRTSIDWSAIEPEQGVWKQDEVDFYRELFEGCRKAGLTPIATLFQHTLPGWLAEGEGWQNPETVQHFSSFARRIIAELNQSVRIWVTFQSPVLHAYYSCTSRPSTPAIEKEKHKRILAHMRKAHLNVYRIIHLEQPDSLVGLATHYWPALLRTAVHPGQLPLINEIENFQSAVFSSSRVEAAGTASQFTQNTSDFVGLNFVSLAGFAESGRLEPRIKKEDVKIHGVDPFLKEISLDADVFREAVRWANGFHLPVYVTEHRISPFDQSIRKLCLFSILRTLWRDVNASRPIRGYLCHTLVDGLDCESSRDYAEGLWGLGKRGGRNLRPEGELYRAICQRGLSSWDAEQYVPELYGHYFPGEGPGDLSMRKNSRTGLKQFHLRE